MIEKILMNLAYLFYPKNICYETDNESYTKSEEYIRLNQIITKFDSDYKEDISKNILTEFRNDYTLKKLTDFTLFDWGDRCMTFNVSIIEDGELFTISLLVSILIPYYIIECKKNEIEIFYSESEISELQKQNQETRKTKEMIKKIKIIIEDKLFYNEFPKRMRNFIISDISSQDARFGYFNMYNAFFNNLKITENEN